MLDPSMRLKMKISTFAVLVYFAHVLHFGNSTMQQSGESRLQQNLFANYNKMIRPVEHPTGSLDVKFGMIVRQVIDFDEQNQVITWNVWARQSWKDYRLQWNESEYGVDRLNLDPRDMWLPDIYLYNNAQEFYHGFDHDVADNAIVNSKGVVTWKIHVIIKSTCRLNVRYFPFDEQSCFAEFGSWTHSGFQINLTLEAEQGDLSNTTENGEWVAVDFKARIKVAMYECCPEPYPTLIFTLKVRRRSMFYILTFMVPATLIALISVLAFFLPYGSGERVSLLITSLLSLTLFSQMVFDMTPPNPDGTPLFGQYMIAVIAEIGIAVAFICVIIDVEGHSTHPPRIFRWYLDKFKSGSRSARAIFARSIIARQTEACAMHHDNDTVTDESNAQTEISKQTENAFNEQAVGDEIRETSLNPLEILADFERFDAIERTIPSIRSCSNTFKDKFLSLVEDLTKTASEKLDSLQNRQERLELAWNIDKTLHCFFLILISLTLIITLWIPPALHL